MNITNQINAALNDVRTTMIELATWAKTPDFSDQLMAKNKIRYQTGLAMQMITDYRDGINQPWSDRKHQVDEEFS